MGVQVTGPDGQMYQFPDGTDKAGAIKYFKTKGITGKSQQSQPKVAAPAAPSTMDYVSEAASGVGRAVKGMVTYPFEAARVRSAQQGGGADEVAIGPTGRVLLHTGQDFMRGLQAGKTARDAAKRQGEGLPGQILSTLENYPVIGGAVRHMESGGPGFTPQTIGGLTELGTYGVAPKLAEEAAGKVTSSYTDPVKNEAAIAKLNQSALKMAEGGVKDPAAYAAIRVAKENIHGNIESVHRQISEAIEAKEAPKRAALERGTAAGKRLGPGVLQEIKQINGEVRQAGARNGTLSPTQVAHLNAFLEQLATKRDPVTGKAAGPRDWQNLPLQEAYDLTRTKGLLSQESEFQRGQGDPNIDVVNAVARRIRGVVTDRLGQLVPDVARLSREQSELVKAREAANAQLIKSRMGTLTTFRGIMNSGASLLVMWMAAREMGVSSAVALGGALVFKRLMEATSSRTLKAALRARFLDRTEEAAASIGGNAPQSPQGGPGATGGPQVPKSPSSPQGPTAQPQVPMAQQLTGGTPQAAPRPTMPELPAAQRQAGGALTVSDPDAMKTINRDMASKVGPTPGARTGRVAEGASGVSPKVKALMDRLDVLNEQLDRPGPGVHNATLREIEQIKKMIAGEGSATEQAKMRTRMLTRERVAKYRVKHGSMIGYVGTEGGTTTSGEAVAKETTLETRQTESTSQLTTEQAYKVLTEFPDGRKYAMSFKKVAKELKWTPEEELEQLNKAIDVLKQVQ